MNCNSPDIRTFQEGFIFGGEIGKGIMVFWLCASGEKRRKKRHAV